MMDSVDIPHTIYMYTITKNPLIEAQSMINNRNKRLQNIKGAFILTDPQVIKGKYVIIVDDVTTTGGTIDEIKKLCMKAGAKKVSAYVVAH
jgi:predicted amidophosphoribosyltransferase